MTRPIPAVIAAALLVACGSELRPEGVPECAAAESSAPIGAPVAAAMLEQGTVVDGKVRVPVTVSVTIACLNGFVHARLTTSQGGFVAKDGPVETTTVLLAPRFPDQPESLAGTATLELAPGQTAWVLAGVGEQTGATCVAVAAATTVAVDCPEAPAEATP